MPELPEVERFRQILLPLINTSSPHQHPLTLKLHGSNLPRKWVPQDDVVSNTDQWCCVDVLRKGKQLCMVLEPCVGSSVTSSTLKRKYFYLHMGMTGRLISPTMSCSWGHKYVSSTTDDNSESPWPPKFTYLLLLSNQHTVAFADPRKFGSCRFTNDTSDLSQLSPDAWTSTATPNQRSAIAKHLTDQKLGIKALLLDQKRAVSGVGNWVADEVLYQTAVHPDQSYLASDVALRIVETLHRVLEVAVDCLDRDVPYPDTWLFGYRWTKKKAGDDYYGRPLTFLRSGGRTSAIVSDLQKLRKVSRTKKNKNLSDSKVKMEKEKEWKEVLEKNKTNTFQETKTKKETKPQPQPTNIKKRTKSRTVHQTVDPKEHQTNNDDTVIQCKKRKTTTDHQSLPKSTGSKKRRKTKNSATFSTSTTVTDPVVLNSLQHTIPNPVRSSTDSDSLPSSKEEEEEMKIPVTIEEKHRRPRSTSRNGTKRTVPVGRNIVSDKDKNNHNVDHNENVNNDKDNNDKNHRHNKPRKTSDPGSKKRSKNKNNKDSKKENDEMKLLKQIDPSIRNDFRSVGFAKWQRRWLPIVQLSPYDVGPGRIRDDWMKLFHKTGNKPPRLVYWYGSPHNNLSSSFSFLKSGAIVGYDEGVRQNRHLLSPTLESKISEGKKLTVAEKMLVQGLDEIKGEVQLKKKDRLGWLITF